MKKEVAMLWADMLESGIYEQGTKFLNTDDGKFCCLGVLCDLAAQFGVQVKEDEVEASFGISRIKGCTLEKQHEVLKWSGLKNECGTFRRRRPRALVAANDTGKTFPEIAALIRKHWRAL